MKAVVCVPGGTEVAEVPDPAPGEGEIVVEVDSCGLCGSDVHAVQWGTTAPGQILGHEFSGTVAALGAGVKGLAVGDPVAVNPVGSCGHCQACERHVPFRCDAVPNLGINAPGAYAEYVAVPARQAVPLPRDLPVWLACDAEPLAVAMNAVTLARVMPGDSVVVYGVGSIGLNAIVALRLLGVDDIVGVGRSPGRSAAALRLGAAEIIDSRSTTLPAWAASHERRFDAVLECSGAPRATDDALAVLAPAGTIVELGVVPHVANLPIFSLVSNQTAVVGSCAFDDDTYARAVAAIVAGQAPVEQMVSERVGLGAVPEALVRLRTPGSLVRIVTSPARHS